MNYFASGIQDGLRIGAESYQKRKDREQQASLDKARRDLELQRDAMRYKNEGDRQQASFEHDNTSRKDTQQFTSTRDATLNGYDQRKQNKSQEFQSGESRLDRDARQLAEQRKLDQDAKQFAEKKALEYAQLGLGATNQAESLAWKKDPENPENKWRSERAAQVEEMNRPFSAPGAPAAPKPPAPAPNSALPAITSKEEYDRLPKGARFSWNGKNGVKN